MSRSQEVLLAEMPKHGKENIISLLCMFRLSVGFLIRAEQSLARVSAH